MLGFDPRFIGFLCLLFIVLGIFNIVRARRQLAALSAQGKKLAWYKHTGLLVGIEYVLLGIVFLISVGLKYNVLPEALRPILSPFYLVVLLASAALAGVVIFQGISNNRRRAQTTNTIVPSKQSNIEAKDDGEEEMTPEQRALQVQKRRERRQKAAQARRRRAGKA
jgi:hypothetical protein